MRKLFKDYRRDWQRWTRGERMTALIVLFLVIGSSAALVMSSHDRFGGSSASAQETQALR